MWGVWLLGATCFSFSAYAQNKVELRFYAVFQW